MAPDDIPSARELSPRGCRIDARVLEYSDAESTTHSGDVSLHVVTAGDPEGDLVVLLHGFPDCWLGWRHQIPALAEAGYRVLVPDQRGYNRSEQPDAVAAYRTSRLAADIAGLVEATGRTSAHVVGHDWGGGVAWELAVRQPGLVDRLAILNAPHPTVFRRALRSNLEQLHKSWYVFAVQLPRFPEWYLGRHEARAVLRFLVASSNPGAFTETDLQHYRAVWTCDGALRGPLNWYRAAARYPDPLPRKRVAPPTRIIWGERDVALGRELAVESARQCEDATLVRVPAATHWVHRDRPETVTEHLRAHFA